MSEEPFDIAITHTTSDWEQMAKYCIEKDAIVHPIYVYRCPICGQRRATQHNHPCPRCVEVERDAAIKALTRIMCDLNAATEVLRQLDKPIPKGPTT